MLTRIATLYRSILDSFIPPALKNDREAANRARMFLVSHTMGPVLGNSVPLALFAFDPTPGYDIAVLAAAISAFWIFPFLLRWGFSYDRLVSVSVLNLNFCVLWSLYFNGGVASPTVPWILIIPILSLFYIGGEQEMRMHLLRISASCFGIFLVCYAFLQPTANDIPYYAMHSLGAVSTVAALCYVATMAIYYARIFDAGRELEHEVRRRRAVMEELREAVIAIERASTAKSDFLARMSHELRTPLNAIIGYGQILKEDAQIDRETAVEEDVDKILDAGQYLLRLINMILDLSKIEAGRMVFQVRHHRLLDIMEAATRERRETIAATGTSVSIDVDPRELAVQVDRARLLQILDAMLENSLRHSSGGTIAIRAALVPSFPGRGQRFSIEVKDDGDGIPADILSTLFTTSGISRDASSSRYGGTGLKLTLTHALCRAMGGTITARSRLGEGSAFVVTLPVEVETPAPTPGTLLQHGEQSSRQLHETFPTPALA